MECHCPLKTCQANNDKEATKCWNCGGPLPKNLEVFALPTAPKDKPKMFAVKDVTIVLKGAGPNGEDLAFRENEEGHWVADGAIQNVTVTGFYRYDSTGVYLDGVKR